MVTLCVGYREKDNYEARCLFEHQGIKRNIRVLWCLQWHTGYHKWRQSSERSPVIVHGSFQTDSFPKGGNAAKNCWSLCRNSPHAARGLVFPKKSHEQ